MKILYTDASFDHNSTAKAEDVVRGKICISDGEGFNLVEKVAVGKVPNLKQYINVFELIAVARAIEVANQRKWNEPLTIMTDSMTARAWASKRIKQKSIITTAHQNALDYCGAQRMVYPNIILFNHVNRDSNPAGKILETELEKESPHTV